jgi:hypothetical protein
MSEQRTVLHGGPFDLAVIIPPKGSTELGLEHRDYRGWLAVYEIKGRWSSFIRMKPLPKLKRPRGESKS